MTLHKEGGKGLTSIKDCVDASIKRFKDYIKISKERLITAASNKIEIKTTKIRK